MQVEWKHVIRKYGLKKWLTVETLGEHCCLKDILNDSVWVISTALKPTRVSLI